MNLTKDFDEQNTLFDDLFQQIYKEYRDIEKEKQPVEFVETANSIVNGPKNRYADVLPIKSTAVKLTPIEGIEDSDYINANFVSDPNLEKSQLFIASQAPPACAFNDFWRMIWEQNVPVIIMITKLVEKNRVKADPYWPSFVGHSQRYGDVTVKLAKEQQQSPGIVQRTFNIWKSKKTSSTSSQEKFESFWRTSSLGSACDFIPTVSRSAANSFEDFTGTFGNIAFTKNFVVSPITSPREFASHFANEDPELASEDDLNFSLSYSSDEHENELEPEEFEEMREVVQLHCTNWPDFGIPESSEDMRQLMIGMNVFKKSEDQPIVVHCSAGIGRTGTFVAIHMCLHRAQLGLQYDIKEIIKHLRTQRIGMVQSKEQYSFVYAVTKDIIERKMELKILKKEL